MADKPQGQQGELKHGAIGTMALVFMVVAAAAPLGASAANTPLIFLLGNGGAAPFDFLFIGLLLIIFAVGFTAMASHVTNAGAFYTYISLGMGKKLGTAAGYVAVFAYNLLSVYCGGVIGAFAADIVSVELGVALPWWVFTIIFAVVIMLFSYFGIEGGTKFLTVCLICEVTVLFIIIGGVVIGEGLGSFSFEAFSFDRFLSGAPGLGLCFAFLCFIGFEATAIFGEEAKDPRHTVPRATYIAVILIAVCYCLSAWAMCAAFGVDGVTAEAEVNATQMLHDVGVTYCGAVVGHIFNFLLIVSALASWMAAHNMASRYMFSFARAGLLPAALARTNKAQSPFNACCVNMVFMAVLVFGLAAFGLDPYTQTGAIASAVAVSGIMLLEMVVCIAVILYLRKHNNEEGYGHNVFETTIAPIIAAIGMAFVIYLVMGNFGLLTGIENTVVNVIIAGLMVLIGVVGFVVAISKDKKGTLVDPVSIEVE